MPSLNKPEIGVAYTYSAVANFFKPRPALVHFVLVRGRHIVALRLRDDYNLNITNDPAEVWIGADSTATTWGDTLANDTGRVPVFVKRVPSSRYTYFGDYEVLSRKATDAELAHARKNVPHKRGVSRIVFLKETSHTTPS